LTLELQHEEKWVNRYTQKHKNVYHMAMTSGSLPPLIRHSDTLDHCSTCSTPAKCRYSYGSNTKDTM